MLGSLIFSRIYFIAFHLNQFNSLLKIVQFYKYPGLSFWGGLFGGILTILILNPKLKMRIWQVADVFMAALFIGITITSLGCLLGSCEYGNPSNAIYAVNQIGVIGKRFPIQLVESILALIGFFYIWKTILRFHYDGQVAGIGLMLLGLIKLVLEPFRPASMTLASFNLSYIYAILLIISGIWLMYYRSKKSLRQDISFSFSLLSNHNRRKQVLLSIKKWWYNRYVQIRFSSINLRRKLLNKFNVKSNPTRF